jgi:hypothetical protein
VMPRPQKRFGEDSTWFRGGTTNGMKTADHIAQKAILQGRLVPQPCEICGHEGICADGRRKVQAHHDDYNFPLRVRWLCVKHHHEWHAHNRPIPHHEVLDPKAQQRLKRKYPDTKVCEVCGVTFAPHHRRRGAQLTCSQKCGRVLQVRNMMKTRGLEGWETWVPLWQ